MVGIKKQIGVVPDISNLYDELSARDNLIFVARLYGVPKALQEKRADDLLKTFGLYDRMDGRFGKFSRRMKRALTIAAALVHEPRVLFLDEPTVGLDVVASLSLRNLIFNLHRRGMTIMLTTHYLEEADQLCDQIAILVKGRLVKIDSPEGLKNLAKGRPAIEVTISKSISTQMDDLSIRLPEIFENVFEFSKDLGNGTRGSKQPHAQP